jgi:membrane protein
MKQTMGLARLGWRIGVGFSEDQVTFLAAGLCYFVVFSFFPLVLVLVAVAGHFLSAEEAMRHAMRVVAELFPAQKEFLIDILRGVMERRGEASLVGFVVLLWTAKNVFMSLGHAMNVIWRVPDRHWLVEHLVATVMALSFGMLIVVSSFTLAVASALVNYRIPIIGWSPTMIPGFVPAIVSVGPMVLAAGILTALYKFLPNRRVRWMDVMPGALVAAMAWELLRRLFGWYLEHVARYDMVYGSLGGIVGFLFWIYVSATIFLLGVEVAKAVADLDPGDGEPAAPQP